VDQAMLGVRAGQTLAIREWAGLWNWVSVIVPANAFCCFLSPAAAVIVLLLTFMQLARAGGPAYIAGISYFNQGTAGTPLTWAHGAVNYYTDQGSLSPTVSGRKVMRWSPMPSASGPPFRPLLSQ
jgi:hypothetical protein